MIKKHFKIKFYKTQKKHPIIRIRIICIIFIEAKNGVVQQKIKTIKKYKLFY